MQTHTRTHTYIHTRTADAIAADKMETTMAAFVEAELMVYFKPLLVFVRATTDPAAIDKDGAAALIKVRRSC